MTGDQLHQFLTVRLGLIPEPVARANSRTYFLHRIEWHPATSTRVARVMFDAAGQPSQLQLCASSDNNNTVLLHRPFGEAILELALQREIALVEQRLQVGYGCRPAPA